MFEYPQECLLGAVQLGGLEVGSSSQQLHTRCVGLSVEYRSQLPESFQWTSLGHQRLSEPELLDDVRRAVGGCHGQSNGTRARAVARALTLDDELLAGR